MSMNTDALGSTLNFIGGGVVVQGTRTKLPEEYSGALSAYLYSMKGPEWQEWWNRKLCLNGEIFYWVGSRNTSISVRRTTKRIKLAINRALTDEESDPGASVARSDVESLISELVKRYQLDAPPRLKVPTDAEIEDWGGDGKESDLDSLAASRLEKAVGELSSQTRYAGPDTSGMSPSEKFNAGT